VIQLGTKSFPFKKLIFPTMEIFNYLTGSAGEQANVIINIAYGSKAYILSKTEHLLYFNLGSVQITTVILALLLIDYFY